MKNWEIMTTYITVLISLVHKTSKNKDDKANNFIEIDSTHKKEMEMDLNLKKLISSLSQKENCPAFSH